MSTTVEHIWIYEDLSGIPDNFFNNSLTKWIDMCRTYIFNSTIPVHVAQYENLIENLKLELTKMLSFLNQTVSSEMLDCLTKDHSDQYQRKVHSEQSLLSQKQATRIQRWIKENEETLLRFNISFQKWTWKYVQ